MFSPIQLKAYDIVSLAFHVNLSFEPSDREPHFILSVRGKELEQTEKTAEAVPFNLDLHTAHTCEVNEEEKQADVYTLLTLEVNSDDDDFKQAPYRIEVSLGGAFVATRLPDDEKDRQEVFRIIHVNTASVLYGIMRQHVLELTRQTRFGGLMLPMLDFRPVIDALEPEKTQKKTRSPRKSKGEARKKASEG